MRFSEIREFVVSVEEFQIVIYRVIEISEIMVLCGREYEFCNSQSKKLERIVMKKDSSTATTSVSFAIVLVSLIQSYLFILFYSFDKEPFPSL